MGSEFGDFRALIERVVNGERFGGGGLAAMQQQFYLT